MLFMMILPMHLPPMMYLKFCILATVRNKCIVENKYKL